MVQGKANRLLRVGEHATQAVDLLSQIELPLSSRFEFFIDGFSGILIQVGRFDLILDQVNVGLPLLLRGSGEVNVYLTVAGQISNTVTIQIR